MNKIIDLYDILKNNSNIAKYKFIITYNKEEKTIYFHDNDDLLILWISFDDESENNYKIYSDNFYAIVKYELINKYLEYYLAIAYDDWTI